MALTQLAVLALCAISVSFASEERCIQGVNCHLPDCFCPTFTHPMGSRIIPQIVYFAFDDAVTPPVAAFFRHIFTVDRVNPNGCPITMSLFVCEAYTDYGFVAEFFSEYDEIGVHSVTHTYINTDDKLRQEATQQKINIEFKANVPGEDIIGWRSPDLITAGDGQPKVLKELNYTYDISLPFEEPGKFAFPYTLDFGYPYRCSVEPCPGKDSKHTGFWEVPINAHWDPVSGIPCCYVDGCRPNSEEEAYQFLMTNFLNSYNGERAPFGLSMHAGWFYWPMYYSATTRFVDTLLDQFPDTYIVSVSQMMAWMKTPQNIEQSKHFGGWDCPWYKLKQAQKTNAVVVEPPKPVPRPDFSKFVDPRLSLNILQSYYLRHELPTSYLNSEHHMKERTDLSKFVDPRLSLDILQNYFLRHELPEPYIKKEQEERRDLSKFVDPRLSLNILQNYFLRHELPEPYIKKEQEERQDLSKFVDPRLSLNILQNYYLRHELPEPYISKKLEQRNRLSQIVDQAKTEQKTGLSQIADPKLSLSATQKLFINHAAMNKDKTNLNAEKPEEKSELKASLLFKSMKRSNNY